MLVSVEFFGTIGHFSEGLAAGNQKLPFEKVSLFLVFFEVKLARVFLLRQLVVYEVSF